MIRETKINLERDETYVDERLCGVNDMTFEEWKRYQDYMLKYYSGYFGVSCTKKNMKTMNPTKKTIHRKKSNHRTKTMNGTRTVEVAFETMTFV